MPEVSTIAGVPRSNAYDALEKMMSKGMCVSRPGNTKRYSASPPDLLRESFLIKLDEETESELQKFKRDQSTALKEKEKEMLQRKKAAEADITRVMGDLQPEYEKSQKQTDPLDYIEIIKDPYQFHKRFMQLADEAKEEMLAFTKPPYTGPKQRLTEQTEQQAQLLRKGLKIRVIYEIPQDKEEFEWWFQDIDANVKYGEEARVIKELPMKMVIFDSTIVLFALEDPISKQPSLTAQVIQHAALAKSLKTTFESFWERAEDYHVLRD